MRLFFAALLALCLLPCAARADQRWLVLSDIHLNPFDTSPQPSPYNSDSNWPLFLTTLEELHRVEPDPPVILIAGDFLAHHWSSVVRAADSGLSPDAAGEYAMRRMAGALNGVFPKAQFVIVLGNNDDPCGDYRTSAGSPYMQQVAKIWEPLVNRGNASPNFVRDFSAAGVYTARLPILSVQALAIDDVYWSIVHRGCGSGPDPSRAQLRFIERALTSRGSERSIPLLHIPPGDDPNSTLLTHDFIIVPFLNDYWNAAFLKTIGQARSQIPFALAGHVHRTDFRMLGGVPMLIAPSVSPIYRNNPGFLDLDVAPDGTLRDFDQYAYDLDAGTWKREADFDSVYGTQAFTEPQLALAHERIARDQSVYEQWITLALNGAPNWEINRGNWRLFWCAQTEYGAAYASCAGVQRRTAIAPMLFGVAAAALLAGLVFLVLRLVRLRRA